MLIMENVVNKNFSSSWQSPEKVESVANISS